MILDRFFTIFPEFEYLVGPPDLSGNVIEF